MKSAIALCLVALAAGCRPSHAQRRPAARDAGPAALPPVARDPTSFAREHPRFEDYWHQGLAEIDRYSLDQARYGGQHRGEAVLVFVTEEFDAVRQVKYEHGERTNVVPVLKLNAWRRFFTGVYPYTVLTSVFSREDVPALTTLKLTSSVTEWCGQAFTQWNLRDGAYSVQSFSYFQDEGDRVERVPEALLEDGLWTRLRRDPNALPIGAITVVPAAHYLRLMHRPLAAVAATATLDEVDESPRGRGRVGRYSVRYPTLSRELVLWFEREFPHRVLAWEERYPDRFGPVPQGAPASVTRGVLTRSLMLDYWNRHGPTDGAYREALGL